MNTDENIRQRAKALGIAEAYWDVEGNYHHIDEDILRYFVKAFAQSEQISAQTADKQPVFDDVRVIDADAPQTLHFSAPVSAWHLSDERQSLVIEHHEQTATTSATSATTAPKISNSLDLPALPFGYYSLRINTTDGEKKLRLIVAPATCYRPDVLQQRQLRGVTLQLYSLRSKANGNDNNNGNDADTNNALRKNWGIGDFADLFDAIAVARDKGFDFVGVNPLHALYPARPEWASPYSPSSRTWLHWVYLSLADIPEFYNNTDNMAWFADNQARIETLRHAEVIDYAAVAQLKMQALELAFDAFGTFGTANATDTTATVGIVGKERRADFINFIKRGGDALTYNSAFYVIDNFRNKGLLDDIGYGDLIHANNVNNTNNANNANNADIEQFIADYEENITFYSYLQWLIDQQLRKVSDHARDCGLALGLYGDLAVGIAADSADAWVNPSLYSLSASVGAPPDPLGPVGQNWGLSPMHPQILKRQGFQAFIDMLRTNMQYYGALRIDHVMGLYRLWLIPAGKSGAEGAYIHYPFAEMMAILAVESQRAQCLIIGEDLGTVPDEVRASLDRYRVLSYDLLYFAGRDHDDHDHNNYHNNYHHGQGRWRKPENVNREALGVVGTHDLPPLKGWWHCCDLKLLKQLEIMTDAELQPMYEARLHDKQALLNALKADGYLPDNYDIDALHMAMHPRLNQAIHAYAQAGETRLFGIQAENFCEVDWAFNVPGTSDEYPNWQRKLPCPLEDINWNY